MIVVNKEGCIRCGACEGICPTSAIAVSPEDVIYCDLCAGEPKCVEICPQGALKTGQIALTEGGELETRVLFNPSLCDRCGNCVEICPPGILKLDEDPDTKVPLKGYCVMCERCVNICPVEVIGVEGVKEPATRETVITGPVSINDCVGCGMCVDECPVSAITLSEPGATIEIDEDTCVYCGICSQTCPWDAVIISGKKPIKRSKEVKSFEVDEDTCIGCNICVESCPGKFIKEKPSNLTVELPEICTYCGLCAHLCPVEAITCDVELGTAKPSSDEGLVYDADKCKMVKECISICPTKAIREDDGSLAHCTRCGACTIACPEGALKLYEVEKDVNGERVKRNRIVFNPSLCNQCGDCVEVCPYHMLKLEPEARIPLKGFCTLCGQCVKACPEGAFQIR